MPFLKFEFEGNELVNLFHVLNEVRTEIDNTLNTEECYYQISCDSSKAVVYDEPLIPILFSNASSYAFFNTPYLYA